MVDDGIGGASPLAPPEPPASPTSRASLAMLRPQHKPLPPSDIRAHGTSTSRRRRRAGMRFGLNEQVFRSALPRDSWIVRRRGQHSDRVEEVAVAVRDERVAQSDPPSRDSRDASVPLEGCEQQEEEEEEEDSSESEESWIRSAVARSEVYKDRAAKSKITHWLLPKKSGEYDASKAQ